MKLINQIEYIEKKSKFIAYYYEINNEEEAKEHKKARHIPFAYKVSNTARKSDDKEPHNTAGTPLFNIIEKNSLNNCFIAVVRYFGGIKLGAGGLLRAYNTAGTQVIKTNTL